MGGSKESRGQYILYCTQYPLDIALGTSAISSIAPESSASGYPLNHPLILRSTTQRTCAINIVGLNTFTCVIEYLKSIFKSLYGFIIMLHIVVVVYMPV